MLKYRHSPRPHPGMLPFVLSHTLSSTPTQAILTLRISMQKLLLAGQAPPFAYLRIRLASLGSFANVTLTPSSGHATANAARGTIDWKIQPESEQALQLRAVLSFSTP